MVSGPALPRSVRMCATARLPSVAAAGPPARKPAFVAPPSGSTPSSVPIVRLTVSQLAICAGAVASIVSESSPGPQSTSPAAVARIVSSPSPPKTRSWVLVAKRRSSPAPPSVRSGPVPASSMSLPAPP